ncbi:MAG: hypothetical protein CMA12_02210 [Euryarchaeota archaeon]|nr:hypothetical protein [Euryarchaeota archaeon]OUW22852.1 MAG: hypothetical protein CBD33_00780 [Euryarchaeota archaeon TMED173]
MSISPRSRWSNRDDSSYGSKKEDKYIGRAKKHDWRSSSSDSSAPRLLIGQITSLVSLAMIYSGFDIANSGDISNSSTWILSEWALVVSALFSLVSFWCLFRVAISRKSLKRRRRIARLWILAVLVFAYSFF